MFQLLVLSALLAPATQQIEPCHESRPIISPACLLTQTHLLYEVRILRDTLDSSSERLEIPRIPLMVMRSTGICNGYPICSKLIPWGTQEPVNLRPVVFVAEYFLELATDNNLAYAGYHEACHVGQGDAQETVGREGTDGDEDGAELCLYDLVGVERYVTMMMLLTDKDRSERERVKQAILYLFGPNGTKRK